MSEDPFGDAIGTKEPRQPRQMPDLPWVQIGIAAAVVVVLIVFSVVTVRAQGAVENAVLTLNSKVADLTTEMAAVKTSVTQSTGSVQNEISGLKGSVQNIEVILAAANWGDDVSEQLDELIEEVANLAGSVSEWQESVSNNLTAIYDILVAANLTAPEA